MPWSVRRITLFVTALLVAGIVVLGVVKWRKLKRAYFVANICSGSEQIENFRSMDQIFPTRVVHRRGPVFNIPHGAPLELPSTYVYAGRSLDAASLLAETQTTGLMVIKDGKLVYENYWHGNDANTRWMSWSVGKSFVSALIGIAVAEGHITGIDDALTKYAPQLKGTAYDGVSIKNALQMSSGVRWSEDYSDSESEVMRFGRTFALGGSIDEFAKSLTREYAPGTFHRYNSLDVQMLGLVLLHATGRTPSAFLEEKIWSKIGASRDAYWVLDDAGAEFAAGGLNMTLRDYAKFGLLYLQEGKWNGKQLVPQPWVKASHSPDSSKLFPGKRANSDSMMGYGYLWWVPETIDGPYSAIGVFNQFLYIDYQRNMVVAKTSASRSYCLHSDEAHFRELETVALFRAIGDKLSTR
jgi:CubicO group peptidase (beta-lactamase class C family)